MLIELAGSGGRGQMFQFGLGPIQIDRKYKDVDVINGTSTFDVAVGQRLKSKALNNKQELYKLALPGGPTNIHHNYLLIISLDG